MKNFIRVTAVLVVMFGPGMSAFVIAQDSTKDKKLVDDCYAAKGAFVKADSLMHTLFDNAAGYVIFPNVGKGGIGVGGAAGNGILFEGGTPVGKASLKQMSVGFQFGGQAYREVIFFETQSSVQRFKQNKFQFSAQASAIAATAGASTNVKYTNGVLVFTHGKGGLMYEASVGGQKFSFSSY